MQEALYIDLIAKHLSGNIEAAEQERLLAWVAETEANRKFFDEMEELWGASAEYEETFSANVDAGWLAVEQKIATPKPTAVIRKLSIGKGWLRIAAAVLLVLSLGYWWWQSAGGETLAIIAVTTGVGQQKTVTLPDGSTVSLNEQSRIAYRSDFAERHVELKGEAFFEVEKAAGKTFTIRSGEALTTVLGTSFNVRAYPKEGGVQVTVKTGKVQFQNAESTETGLLLLPGDAGVFEKETQALRKISQSATNADAWKTHSLSFSNISVEEVIGTLERYFEVEIDVENASTLKCEFTMNMQQNPKLEEIFQIMEFTMNLKVEQRDGKYLLTGDGC